MPLFTRVPTPLLACVLLFACALFTACSGDDGDDNGELTLGDGECRSAADCSTGADLCLAPGESAPCGICMGDECADDTTCGPGTICGSVEASCNCGLIRACVPVCTANSCSADKTCNDMTGRCEPSVCTADADCPELFACAGGRCALASCTVASDCRGDSGCNGSVCVEKQCSADADCGAQHECTEGVCGRLGCMADADCNTGGLCVKSRCHETPGTCAAIPP